MPLLDVIDETFVVAPPPVVAAAVKDPAFWAEVFPGLELTVFQDRGDEGIRLTVTGALVGSNEFWIEPWGDGAIVHYYLRADPVGRVSPRRAVKLRTRHCVRLKAGLNAIKDRLEAARSSR